MADVNPELPKNEHREKTGSALSHVLRHLCCRYSEREERSDTNDLTMLYGNVG